MILFGKKKALQALLDEKNVDLWNFVDRNYKVSIKLYNGNIYGAKKKDKKVVMFVPKKYLKSSLFTHELLHLKINVYANIGLVIFLASKDHAPLNIIFNYTNSLLMGNLIEHAIMYNEYMKLGYDEEGFVCDYLDDKFTDLDKKKIKEISYTIFDLENLFFYISKYIVLKSVREKDRNYGHALEYMREVNSNLYDIMEKFYNNILLNFSVDLEQLGDSYVYTIGEMLESVLDLYGGNLLQEINKLNSSGIK